METLFLLIAVLCFNTDSKCRIKSVQNGRTRFEYHYSNDGQLAEIHEGKKIYKIKREANTLTVVATLQNANQRFGIQKIVYKNNLPVKSIGNEFETMEYPLIRFFYSNNYLRYSIKSSNGILEDFMVYVVDKSGNILEERVFGVKNSGRGFNNDLKILNRFSYDENPNPFYYTVSEDLDGNMDNLNGQLQICKFFSRNNVVSSTTEQFMINRKWEYNYQYQYNTKGYPTSVDSESFIVSNERTRVNGGKQTIEYFCN